MTKILNHRRVNPRDQLQQSWDTTAPVRVAVLALSIAATLITAYILIDLFTG